MDYLTLLLNTYINQKDIFSEVIQNRQRDFEKNNSISKNEFYFNCSKIVENINSQIDNMFYKRINELHQIIDLKNAKGEPITDIQNELNDIQKNQFGLPLFILAGGNFRGHIFWNDIEFIENCINKLKIEKQSKININQKENINVESFFENIENHTGFERKKIVSNLTNNFDLNLLTELSNSFVQYCFLKFNKINYSLPTIERPEKKEGDISLNEFHFPFYDFIQNEIQKEVRIETFNNISFNDCLKFNSYMNTFLDEIENIIENQNIKINGIKVTTEAINTETATTTENKVFNFSLNDWNEKTFNLFIYLIDNYQTKGKVKYTNIFKFLKNIDKTNYAFNFTEEKYKAYILENYIVKITTFNTANYKYEDKEQPILNSFECEFRKQSTK